MDTAMWKGTKACPSSLGMKFHEQKKHTAIGRMCNLGGGCRHPTSSSWCSFLNPVRFSRSSLPLLFLFYVLLVSCSVIRALALLVGDGFVMGVLLRAVAAAAAVAVRVTVGSCRPPRLNKRCIGFSTYLCCSFCCCRFRVVYFRWSCPRLG